MCVLRRLGTVICQCGVTSPRVAYFTDPKLLDDSPFSAANTPRIYNCRGLIGGGRYEGWSSWRGGRLEERYNIEERTVGG